jgi:hypothetical protein
MVIPLNNFVWRIAMVKDRDRKNRQVPAICNFSLHAADEFKLSVDWDQHTTAEQCIARVGATYRGISTIFKDYENREIYAINTSNLKNIEAIEQTMHAPISVTPCKRGSPNNPAHSLIYFISDFDEPEVYSKLREYAKDNRINHDIEATHILVQELRNECPE